MPFLQKNAFMATILNIETSTEVCSVCISRNGEILSVREDLNGRNHSRLLTVYIQECLDELKLETSNLDAVSISAGPGSYTGLRIGVSAAKGICFASNLPFIAVCPLQTMAYMAKSQTTIEENAWIAPMMDARRMEVYTGIYNYQGKCLEKVTAKIIDENAFSDQLDKNLIYFCGNGAEKCKSIIHHPNARFLDSVYCSSKAMISLSEQKFEKKEFVDVAYFEPYYLKDFITTVSKKNPLSM